MSFNFKIQSAHYEGTGKSLAWLVRQTTLARIDWGQVGNTTLVYRPNGRKVEMGEDTTLNFAIHAVIQVEYGALLPKSFSSWEVEMMLDEAHRGAELLIAKKYRPSE
jgi:hypothetical protein